MILNAIEVRVKIDEDFYEDEVCFVFPHPTREWDCLTITWNYETLTSTQENSRIWVSRRMPFYSGCSGIERLLLRRNEVAIVFTRQLAESLELECELSIVFDVDDAVFGQLSLAFSRIFDGCGQYIDESKGP